MSILDTFYLVFKSDTSGLHKGADEALALVRNLKSTLLAAIPAGFAAYTIKGAIDFGTELSKTARLLNVNVQDLNAWRNAVELAGGDAGQFENTIASLASRFNTSSNVILKLLPRYADALSKLSPERAQYIGKNLFGLDEGTILLLQRSRREVDNMVRTQKSLSTITQQNAQQFLIFDQQVKQIKISMQGLLNLIAIEALPYFLRFYEALEKTTLFLINHKDVVIGALIGIGGAIGLLTARFALLNTATFFWRLAALLLAAAIALVYDDIKVFLAGGDSVIGYLIDKFPNAAKIAAQAFKDLGEVIKDVFDLDFLGTTTKAVNVVAKNNANQLRHDTFKSLIASASTPLPPAFLQSNSLRDTLSNINNSKKIEIHNLTIQTQAKDGDGIMNTLDKYLNSAYAQVINNAADGVMS